MFMNDYGTSLMIIIFMKSLIFVVTVCHKCTNTYEGTFICLILFHFIFFLDNANGSTRPNLAMICAPFVARELLRAHGVEYTQAFG
jgi:hypothetical protein